MSTVKCMVVALILGAASTRANDVVIESFDSNGYLVATGLLPGSAATVEWASSPDGPWTNTWESLSDVLVDSSGMVSVSVPMFERVMFYRVQGIANQPLVEPAVVAVGALSVLMVAESNAQEEGKPLNPEYKKLVEQLGDASFTVRERATADLIKLGWSARAEVIAGLASPDPEISYRSRRMYELFSLSEYLLQNPSKIESLNPAKARGLLEKSPKVGYLYLQGLKSIDKDVARELAKFEGNCLYLIGLESIDEDVARELASFKGDLLDKSPGWLRLEGLVAIDKDVARELAKFEGTYLALRGLKSIDKDMARELTSYTGYLDLQGLKSIDKDMAQELAKFEGKRLGLNGLESIDQDVARKLGSLKGALSLGGLKSMNKDVAKELAKFSGVGGLSLGLSLKSIDKDVARELAKWKGKYLSLSGLESIDNDTAQELSKFEGHCMYLTGLRSIDTDSLEILKSNPAIKLPGNKGQSDNPSILVDG